MLTIPNLKQRTGVANPFKINRYHINIVVNNQLATTKIDQIFINPNDFIVDGVYIFPVPDNVTSTNLVLSIDSEPVKGELYSKRDARDIYRSSAHLSDNAAILEHLGTRAFVVEVPNIPAKSERRIQFEYSQIVDVDSDLAKYIYPLSLAKSAYGPIANLAVEMEIESDHELRTIFSPAQDITINRKDDRHVSISYEDVDVDPDDDFLCYYSVSDDNFGITLFTHRTEEDEAGYFMLQVTPKYEVKKTDIIEKDFIFVLDHSGSMQGNKIEQAKNALCHCVQNLNDGDRFNLILFNSEIISLSDRLNRREEWFGGERSLHSAALSNQLIDVKDGREIVINYIESIEAGALTNINDALLTALADKQDPNRPKVIVFLTDGRPTAGETNEAQILENVAEANRNQSRIFVFGVGYDVNVRLLDKIAMDNGGSRNYVEPNENIEDAVSSLLRKINEPVLVNVELNFGGIVTKDMVPGKLPDMFRGEQFTLLGRYEESGDTVLKLRGKIGIEQHEFTKEVSFSELKTDHDFLPHLWAQRRIAELVDEAALNGSSRELDDEIERLSRKYGVQTAYTQHEAINDGTLRRQFRSQIRDAYSRDKPTADAVRDIKMMEEKRLSQYRMQDSHTKRFGRKTFDRISDKWVDFEYDGISECKVIEFNTNDFYSLMKHIPDLAKCTKIGLPMIICHAGVNYEIIEPKA
ncbi:MAG: VWA domain-containing protein [Candidatus Poribacteria bacterium]|nr:VWA domain-containing protein [Candidatus Poribacteria bacterium]